MRAIILLLCLLSVPAFAFAGQAEGQANFLASRQIVGQVFFSPGSAKLSASAKQSLDQSAERLAELVKQGKLIRVEGFSDHEGRIDFNLKLSFLRAMMVKAYLAKQHAIDLELFFTGFGERNETDDKLMEKSRVDLAAYDVDKTVRVLFDESAEIERYNVQ